MNWEFIEREIGGTIPNCVKDFMVVSGFETVASLKNITSDTIIETEQYINNNARRTIENLTCKHSKIYQEQNEFKFLPGHRNLLLNFPTFSCNVEKHVKFSLPLQKMIETAEKNFNKLKFHNKYDDVIRFFATYVFLQCGRSCYEFLSRNLPFPSIKTICKFIRN